MKSDDRLLIQVIDDIVHDHDIERPFRWRHVLEVVFARKDRVVEAQELDRSSQCGKRM